MAGAGEHRLEGRRRAMGAIAMFCPAARPSAQGSLPLEWAKAAPLAIAMLFLRPARLRTRSFFTFASPCAARVWLIIVVSAASLVGYR